MSGRRHAVQRSNRVRLKADLAVLLKRVVGVFDGAMVDGSTRADVRREVMEMQIRLHPPSGARAPVVLTGYTKARKNRGPAPDVPIDWNATAVLRRPVDGMDERFGLPLDSIRYRKD